jgi:hypothetical protein
MMFYAKLGTRKGALEKYRLQIRICFMLMMEVELRNKLQVFVIIMVT